MRHTLCGFGFGPIQAGLFVAEASAGGAFERIVVAEIDRDLVEAVRGNGGRYSVNVARAAGVEAVTVGGVEIVNPNVDDDRAVLVDALGSATEVVTSLPSVAFYDRGGAAPALLLADALTNGAAASTLVYTAENNNRAAEVLCEAVDGRAGSPIGLPRVQYANTVIGKMSQVVSDPAAIREGGLVLIAPGIDRAFLVEEFNRIFVSRCSLPGFEPGIGVFMEKEDLVPFEEAKLYGHNAVHALVSYLLMARGHTQMTGAREDDDVMRIARAAFLEESGKALIRKHGHLGDPLFTEAGYRGYAEDLLRRMTNPFLSDPAQRIGRDPVRKLGYDDRIFGTMRAALEQNVEPANMAIAAMAAIAYLVSEGSVDVCRGLPRDWRRLSDDDIVHLLNRIWGDEQGSRAEELISLVQAARPSFATLVGDN
jgi:mannitol-1-phosphate 5-dehydrogenase